MMELDKTLDELVRERKLNSKKQKQEQSASSPQRKSFAGKAKKQKKSKASTAVHPYAKKASTKNNNTLKVIVKNLDNNTSWQALKDHMQSAGYSVAHADLIKTNENTSGIVQYISPKGANDAIKSFNKTKFNGRVINVVKSSTDDAAASGGVTSSRVFVGNLSYKTEWQDLKDHMKNRDNIVYCDVLKDANHKSKGCGLVEYESPSDASEAIATLNDSMLDGSQIFVRPDKEPEAGSIATLAKHGVPKRMSTSQKISSNASVFVGNLPFDTTWQELKDIFKKFNPTHADVFKGYGIVTFQSAGSASRAIDELHQATFDSRVLNVRFDKEK